MTDVPRLSHAEATLYLPRTRTDALARYLQWRQVGRTRKLARRCDALLIGDSIAASLLNPHVGRTAVERAFAAHRLVVSAVPGDCTNHVLQRIARGEFRDVEPRVVIVALGTNMIAPWYRPAIVADSIGRLLDLLRADLPDARFVVQGVLPQRDGNDAVRTSLNAHLARHVALRGMQYVEFDRLFVTSDGTPDPALYVDAHHPSTAGIERLVQALAGCIGRPGGNDPALVGPSALFWNTIELLMRLKRRLRALRPAALSA